MRVAKVLCPCKTLLCIQAITQPCSDLLLCTYERFQSSAAVQRHCRRPCRLPSLQTSAAVGWVLRRCAMRCLDSDLMVKPKRFLQAISGLTFSRRTVSTSSSSRTKSSTRRSERLYVQPFAQLASQLAVQLAFDSRVENPKRTRLLRCATGCDAEFGDSCASCCALGYAAGSGAVTLL